MQPWMTRSAYSSVFGGRTGSESSVNSKISSGSIKSGERDREGAARAAVQGILLGLALALILGVAGGTLAPRALRVMGASPDVVA